MMTQVLVIGGQGRIGSSVAADLIDHTQAEVIVTGRSDTLKDESGSQQLGSRVRFLQLDLADQEKLRQAIAQSDVVVHCAGPFHYRDTSVLKFCIEQGVDYVDVSDTRGFTEKALSYQVEAEAAGVTAVVNSGVFPGISNSMVRQGVEQLDQAEEIRLYYVVSGSGGAGVTVMRTTFLGLLKPFEAWIDGQWRKIKPYTERQKIHLPAPYGTVHTYWYEMPETFTLVNSFPVKTVVTKFGSVPDFYNHLTWIAANVFPKSWLQNPNGVEFLSHVSYRMTSVTDLFSGRGVGVQAEVVGQKAGQPKRYRSALVHSSAAIATGLGTGCIAQFLLSGQLKKPGVWAVEQALPTDLFEQAMQARNITIQQEWV
ncbi:saccharopine dehydrogenase NADP-binding domain-containing protein [Oculatella sp. FACHB-28]|uniref:saccharopine dehydrogenase NADP-binding domain-containing protein n=1 Tax=Oculatella sp. FACHB-28 TaxID=2692845 RepID=UPI0016885F22|nr:saccharopine dehydrogenase NADP-binding domain-containing protein [Oculatella sp. FACHB-28]